eukprot:gene15523-15334_t
MPIRYPEILSMTSEPAPYQWGDRETMLYALGIGLGGEFGIGMALAAEAWPARHRARVSSYVALGWQLGVLGA